MAGPDPFRRPGTLGTGGTRESFQPPGTLGTASVVLAIITGDHSCQDQMLLVKMVKHIGFYVYHRSC